MSSEALPKQTLDPTIIPESDIAAAFVDAQKIFYKFTQDPHFHARCGSEGIDPYEDVGTADYWLIVAEYGNEAINSARTRNGESVKLSALELLTATPAYVYEQDALDNNRHRNTVERKQAKEQVSYYNSLIRDFAGNYPDTNVTDLVKFLTNMTDISIENAAMRNAASRQITATVRGAQHEVGFGQILVSTGRSFRETTLKEDLEGIDYVVQGIHTPELKVDVKASSNQIITLGGTPNGYARKHNGKIVIFSQIEDYEFNNRFTISNSAAEQKAVRVDQLLHAAELNTAVS